MDNTSRAATDAAYQTADYMLRGTQTSLEIIIEALRRQGAANIPDELSAWDKSGGTFTMFSADRSVLSDMQSVLVENNIPFVNSVDAQGEPFIVIRDCDMTKVDGLKKDVLIRQSGYYVEVSLDELHSAASNAASNRRIAGLSGLTEEAAEFLVEKANNFGRGVTVAKEKMTDGTYYVAVSSQSFMTDSQYKMDLAQAYAEMTIALYGPNAERNHQDVENRISFNTALGDHIRDFYAEAPGEGPDARKESWIIGRNDSSQYVRFTNDGAEFGFVTKNPQGDRVFYNAQDTIALDAPDFEERVYTFCSKIKDKEILAIRGDVDKHFLYHGNKTHGYSDWTPAERRIDNGERRLIRAIDRKIKDNMRGDGILKERGNEQQKMMVYISSMRAAFDGIRSGVRPERFTKEQWTDITTVASANGMNLAQYADAVEKLEFYELNGYEVDSRFYEMEDMPLEERIRGAKARDVTDRSEWAGREDAGDEDPSGRT